jgi:hypothetical protein
VLIHEPKADPSRAKEVKVKIPVGFHVKLHSMKVLTGKAISDAVTEALEAYFAAHRIEDMDTHAPPEDNFGRS